MKRANIVEMMKRLLLPGYTDKKVKAINRESQEILAESAVVAKRYNALLKKNGVTMRIAIAAGHGEKGVNHAG